FAGSDAAVAVFAADGALLHATPAAAARLGEATSLEALAADSAAADARTNGHASGESAVGPLTLQHLGSGGAGGVVAVLSNTQFAETVPHPEPLPASGERAPAAESEMRRHPLRFVWQIDPDGCFTLGSEEFAEAMGPRTAALIGRPWREMCSVLGLDPEERVEQAIASRETWSGIHLAGPLHGAPAPVDRGPSGLPTLDRRRAFRCDRRVGGSPAVG